MAKPRKKVAAGDVETPKKEVASQIERHDMHASYATTDKDVPLPDNMKQKSGSPVVFNRPYGSPPKKAPAVVPAPKAS